MNNTKDILLQKMKIYKQMRNYALILLLISSAFSMFAAYSQTPQTFETNRVTVKRYGLALPGRSLDFMYEFVYPTSDVFALPKIREQMLEIFFGRNLPNDKLNGNFNDQLRIVQTWYEDKVIRNYTDEIPRPDGWPGELCSYNFKTSAIRNIHNKIMVFCIDAQYANGIAHGRHGCTCVHFDLHTGERIPLKNLFDEANIKRLDAIVNEVLKSQDNYTVGTKENFIMLPKGIQFVYNEYIAGPYSAGVIRITVPLSKFRHLLKDSALTYFEE